MKRRDLLKLGASAATVIDALRKQADQQKIKAALDRRWYQPVTPELPIARSVVCEDVLTAIRAAT